MHYIFPVAFIYFYNHAYISIPLSHDGCWEACGIMPPLWLLLSYSWAPPILPPWINSLRLIHPIWDTWDVFPKHNCDILPTFIHPSLFLNPGSQSCLSLNQVSAMTATMELGFFKWRRMCVYQHLLMDFLLTALYNRAFFCLTQKN